MDIPYRRRQPTSRLEARLARLLRSRAPVCAIKIDFGHGPDIDDHPTNK